MVVNTTADAKTNGTEDYWYVVPDPRGGTNTVAMTAPTLSPCEPTRFTVGGIEGLSKFSWEMFLKEGTGKVSNVKIAANATKGRDNTTLVLPLRDVA